MNTLYARTCANIPISSSPTFAIMSISIAGVTIRHLVSRIPFVDHIARGIIGCV